MENQTKGAHREKIMTSQAEEIKREASPWIERLARVGYVAKGIVYVAIGFLAFQAAFLSGGATTNKEGALREIVRQPFGEVVLLLVIVGFAGYGLWQLVRGLMDSEHVGTDMKGLFNRARYIGAGVVYLGLAGVAAQIMLSNGASGGGGNSSEMWTARIMAQPFGRWLVGLAGLVVIGAAVNQFYIALSEKFLDKFKVEEMDEREREVVTYSGKIGLMARGVVVGIVGWFLIQAAWQYDPQEVGGLGEALRALALQPYGPWLLGIVALGLIVYGVYAIVQGRYRVVHV